jgi:hypothetical protein
LPRESGHARPGNQLGLRLPVDRPRREWNVTAWAVAGVPVAV